MGGFVFVVRMKHHSLFLVFLLVSALFASLTLAQNEDDVLALFTTTQSGEGTYYGSSSSGSCTLDQNLPPVALTSEIYSTVAMNNPQYYSSLSCGMCIQMTGEGVGSGNDPIDGTFIVFVTDLCPECSSGDLDVARSGDGRWDIEWVAVNCPGSYGNIQYMGQGSNNFFLKIQVRNHRVPVSQLYLLNADGKSRITMDITSDNFYVYQSSSSLSGDFTVEVESVDGQLLTDVINIDQVISSQPFTGLTGVQFNAISAGSTSSPTPQSTPASTPTAAASGTAPATPASTPTAASSSSRTPASTPTADPGSNSQTSFSTGFTSGLTSFSSGFTSLTSFVTSFSASDFTSLSSSSFTSFSSFSRSTSSPGSQIFASFGILLVALMVSA